MERTIPLTNFGAYTTEARAIRQALKSQTTSADTMQEAVTRLTDLAVRALEEANQTFEGLAALVMAMHPEITRTQSRQPSELGHG